MKINGPHFYIIYTPGTIRLLMGLVFSLLRWSNAEFTLVSNGNSEEEQNQLQRLCDSNDRLHYYSLDSTTVMSHGAALNVLQDQNTYQDFGFIDSDIYAIADFWTTPANFDDIDAACQFIPAPASFRLPEEIKSLKENRLGCSYFMRYDNEKISTLRSNTGVHFDKYQWQTMPKNIRDRLDEAGLKRLKYDTARVINAMLLADGENVVELTDTSLRHLGGVSRIRLQRQRSLRPLLESLIGIIPNRNLRTALINIALDRQQAKFVTNVDQADDKRARKRLVNHYFYDLLLQLTQHVTLQSGVRHKPVTIQGLPSLPISGYSTVDQYVDQITQELIALFGSLDPHQLSQFSEPLNLEHK